MYEARRASPGGPPVLLERFFGLLAGPLPNVQASPVGGDALERHVAPAPHVFQFGGERLFHILQRVVFREQTLHQDLEPQHGLRTAASELSQLWYGKHLFGRRESRVNEQGVDVRGAQQSACELPSVPPGPGCEDGLFFRLATEEVGQRPDETPVEGRARDVVSRHLRLCRLGEGLPPAREVIERLVPQYAVAVIVHDGDLGEVYSFHTPPPFKASRGRDSSIRPAARNMATRAAI